jgi:hypothetical protein
VRPSERDRFDVDGAVIDPGEAWAMADRHDGGAGQALSNALVKCDLGSGWP